MGRLLTKQVAAAAPAAEKVGAVKSADGRTGKAAVCARPSGRQKGGARARAMHN